ncbi:ATP-binding cassette subfamily C member 4-like [Dermatophagoides pteronyssinus]|uniref:ATP-binding cassette subfamily C member 4-like n=1 Tax=Dermatophagoides pteronyssinus TaxID=6956 RepID=UPI003F6657BE
MDHEEIIKKQSKFDQSFFFNKIYSTWVFPLYYKGLRNEIQMQDLTKCSTSDDTEKLCNELEKNWRDELRKKKPSFALATVKSFKKHMLFSLILFLFEECILRNVQPLMLAKVIDFFARPSNDQYLWACLNAAGVVGASFFYILCHHPACYGSVRCAIKVRVAWCTLMYKKALRLHNSAFKTTTVGQILNLMSNDVSRLDEFCIIGSYMIAAPIQTIIGMYICYQYIGYYCLIGLAILILFIPFNSFNGRIFLKVRTKVAALSDTRIRIVSEIIKGMRVIKMYAWEDHFLRLVSEARRRELIQIRNATFLRAMNISISLVAGRIVLFAMFITYVLEGHFLNADKVFVVMTVVNTLRHTMTWLFPNSIALLSELSVSCNRIQTFLELDEIEQQSIAYHNTNIPVKNNENSIIIKQMDAVWSKEQEQPTLINLSLTIKKSELIAVIGSVGSGKSTFLMSLMNEIQITSGTITLNGRIAYASQEPWSFNGSLRDNILFGKPFNSKKYQAVIDVCAMKRDLKQLQYGDRTLVGERGVSLSGGQKARLTLARALYNDADIYLLDDPLSAVDAEVANHIFEKCISYYLRSKTVILVTHQMQFIRKASKILILNDGRQLAYGSFDEIINSGIDLVKLIQRTEKEKVEKKLSELQRQDSENQNRVRTDSMTSRYSTTQIVHELNRAESCVDVAADEPAILDEEKTKGSISSKIYWQYIRAGSGPILMTSMILSTIISQILFHYTDVWLADWTNREDATVIITNKTIHISFEVDQTDEIHPVETNNAIIYTILVVTQFIGMIIRSGTFFAMCIFASINLHNRIFYCLMRAPVSFFDTVPTGRILNRFTKDMGIIDEQLPLAAYDLNLIIAQVIGTCIVVALSQWYLIFPAIIMIILILIIRAAYIRTARDLKRYEAIARSPLFNHMTVTLNGLATIRSFNVQQIFTNQYYRYQNDHTATYFVCYASSRFLGICMDMICIGYIVIVAISLMAFYHGIQSGTAGLAFSMALGLTGMTQWGVRQSAEVENQMTSVERIIEYSELKPEASLKSDYKFLKNWPQNGQVIFDHVYLTYDGSSAPVLKDLCFEINGGEKIGIVGRTGAGKSSILAALFRMIEIDGKITIDNVNCRDIGLHELRSKMSIIPQEPVAFIGSLRKNLDPFDDRNDEEIWSALEKVQLKNVVNEMPGKLEYQLSEGGGNLSVGQRQLICLARALLRRNKILVLDEATANVDHHTDSLIQQTIRNNFDDCTVITIAHRLNTIIDSDRILVLDAGRVAQFDTPNNLLQDSNGIFYNLIEQTGPQMAEKLKTIASTKR